MTGTAMDNTARGGSLKLHRGATFGEVSISPLQQQTRRNQALSKTGTGLAVSTSLLSVGPYSGAGRGGARNRADRQSYELTSAQVANLIAAMLHAEKIGLPLNRMITIHWERAGVPLEKMARATGRFLDIMAKFLKRHGYGTAWLWSHENGPGKGGHCHILAHVPAPCVSVLSGRQRAWISTITGTSYRARVIRSKPIGGLLGLETGNPLLHAANLGVAMDYCLKASSSPAHAEFGLERRQAGGLVIGKRCGTSQNISRKARNTWKATQ